MRIFITLLFVFSTSLFAEVSRDDAKTMIDEMVKSNTISVEEGEKAKARLVIMDSSEWKELNKVAEVQAGRMPASAIEADPTSSDLSKEQFSAIENDLKAIAPHYTVTPRKPVIGILGL